MWFRRKEIIVKLNVIKLHFQSASYPTHEFVFISLTFYVRLREMNKNINVALKPLFFIFFKILKCSPILVIPMMLTSSINA